VTADGRIGGVLNRHVHLRDMAAPLLIVEEAGQYPAERCSNSLDGPNA